MVIFRRNTWQEIQKKYPLQFRSGIEIVDLGSIPPQIELIIDISILGGQNYDHCLIGMRTLARNNHQYDPSERVCGALGQIRFFQTLRGDNHLGAQTKRRLVCRGWLTGLKQQL